MDLRLDLTALLICFGLVNTALGSCVWYGQCGENPAFPGSEDHLVNCLYRGEPKPFNSTEAIDKFKFVCPDFYHGVDTEVCCSDDQIIALSNQIAVPQQTLLRCPSCLRNFLAMWCHFTCSPKQSDYLNVNQTAEFVMPDNTTVTQITAVDYSVSETFANGLYNSCLNVQSPSSNQPALSLLCGQDRDTCSPEIWLNYMGNTANTQAPFDIAFHITDQNITYNATGTPYTNIPMDWKTYKCSEAPDDQNPACSCPDCPKSCTPLPPTPPPVKPCEILHVSCYDFAFTLVFAGFLLVFGIFTICYNIVAQVSSKLFAKRQYFKYNISLDSLRLEKPGTPDDKGCCGFMAGSAPRRPPATNRKDRRKLYLENMSLADLGMWERAGAHIESSLERGFRWWGGVCTRNPFKVILTVLIISGGLCAGIYFFQVTTNPVKLWSGPDSRARTEKDYFDSHFVPFFRTEMLIITRPNNKTKVPFIPDPTFHPNDVTNFTSIFDLQFLNQLLDLQHSIEKLTAVYDNKTVTLNDICLKPLSPDNNNCTIMSIFNYFQNSKEVLNKKQPGATPWNTYTYFDHILFCSISPISIQDMKFKEPCLGTFGGPVFPYVAFGGFKDDQYNTSEALTMTFVVNNNVDESKNAKAEAWELVFINFMKNYLKENPDLTISFSSERSVEDEIDRESSSDILTILISYLIMFAYITIMLGRYRSVQTILVDSKVVLGLAGVFIVLVSVGASLGFYSYLGIPSTLIIVEVVPFLVLAVGVDNIFILVQTYQREKREEGETLEEMIARVVGKVGPSMLLTSSSESMAFFLGALTDMPAVKVFSLYAAMAVLFDFLLQITAFISLLYLDAKREEKNRMDLCCCVVVDDDQMASGSGLLYTFMDKYYTHFLMKEWVRPIVMIVFVGYFCASGAMVSRLGIGLDQKLSMPEDSYVLNYFGNLTEYLSVGPPVYFVVRDGHDYSNYAGQNQVCGIAGCEQTSVVQQINHASLIANSSYIAQPTSSWLDDYFSWLAVDPCCREYTDDLAEFCPSTEVNRTCQACNVTHQTKGRPVDVDFYRYLPWYLSDNPNIKCAKGGHAAYGSAVELHNTTKGETRVGATYFMTYHSILKTSADYINALKEARAVADNITLSMGGTGEVFPYSVFYVYYEQYLTIEVDSALNILYCLIAIFVISFLMMGLDLYSAIMVVVTILMIIVDIMGMMYMWNIDLNALSLVNLIMAIGISVEFCSHIIRAFAISVLPTRKERAKDALGHMGSSVLSGITMTKLGGIIVLAFSKSQLFQVFYFRMYFGMVVYGASHGLIFLPVLLSYVGPPVNKYRVYMHNLHRASQETSGEAPSSNGGARATRVQGFAYDNPPAYNVNGES